MKNDNFWMTFTLRFTHTHTHTRRPCAQEKYQISARKDDDVVVVARDGGGAQRRAQNHDFQNRCATKGQTLQKRLFLSAAAAASSSRLSVVLCV